MSKYYATIPQMMEYIQKNYNNTCALGYKDKGEWKKISTQDFYSTVTHLALGLHDLKLQKGDKVGIMAEPSPFWVMMDQAILAMGCITVPLFPNVSEGNLKYEIEESEMKYVFLSGSEQWEIVKPHREYFKKIILLDYPALDGPEGSAGSDNLLMSYQDLSDKGASIFSQNPELFKSFAKPAEDDLATIIYTSGSTGIPKGVEISHKNLIAQIDGAAEFFPIDSAIDSALSALPLAHVFERMVTMYYMSQGISLHFAEDVKKIGDNLRELSPTIVTLVPRLLEKVFAKMQGNVDSATGLKKFLGSKALDRAVSRDHNMPATLQDKLFDKLVYSKMRAALGGKIRLAISGSAPLSPSLYNFFLNIGLPLYEGYGCTETSPVLSANYPGHRKVGTVGPIFPQVEVKIAEDNEILAKGPNVMRGYYKNDEETKKVLDAEGYYHTGDLGSLDSDNFLKITGRKKELFKTVNGKYVSPVPIEAALINKSKLVDLAMVVAESKKYVTALIFPDFETLDDIKASMNLSHLSHDEFIKSKEVKASLQATIDEVNKDLNHWEQIQKFTLSNTPISPESGELTPSMKIRRHIVEEKFSGWIDSMYAD